MEASEKASYKTGLQALERQKLRSAGRTNRVKTLEVVSREMMSVICWVSPGSLLICTRHAFCYCEKLASFRSHASTSSVVPGVLLVKLTGGLIRHIRFSEYFVARPNLRFKGFACTKIVHFFLDHLSW